ncbi:MAG TPA: hypothetical protein VEP89_07555, partial [Draconibacterium sp.]|nr:hypothetical protein [Draconibacterium sp.]
NVGAQTKYTPLDKNDPVIFNGDNIIYKGKKIELGPKAFFVDGQLSDADVTISDYVFNSVNEAAKFISDGSEENPMVMYIAPYVYWIDDPDDPEVRVPKEGGGTPFGLEIDCEWLRFQGLSGHAENVVLACNRGQTMGAKGNYTMFKIIGNGTSAENITFGNYCNIDLEFPLKPELNRKKRGSAIVQAQLVFCSGDKIFARNTHFVSRLNLLPFYGGTRTLFDHCHFESTDDALAPKAVYLDCTFDFYSSKPFGGTIGTGAVLLNCDITSFARGEQYLVKGDGPVAVIDCRMNGELVKNWGWRDQPAFETKYYDYNNSLNDKSYMVGEIHLWATVSLKGKRALNAYRFEFKNEIVYNTFNLLRGNDNWDPMGIQEKVLAAEAEKGVSLTNIPTQLLVRPTQKNLETGKEPVTLSAIVNCYSRTRIMGEKIHWSVDSEYADLVKLKDNMDGSCTVIPVNEYDDTRQVIVKASTEDGLEAAAVLYVAPRFLDAPEFINKPEIVHSGKGLLTVTYKLDSNYPDQSLVSWYRCSDASGSDPIQVAVSRFNEPCLSYKLSEGDVGYMMVSVEPKHLRCNKGEAVYAVLTEKISADQIIENRKVYQVNLKNMATQIQPDVLPGFWTVDCFKPRDTNEWNDWTADNSKDSWYYGVGENGAANDTGLVQASKGARLRYTPVGDSFGDMTISFTAYPAKTAGQGFSSAKSQYMDICIQFDTKKLNGYALRLFRTTKYHNAIDCMFVEYKNGEAVPISEPVSTSCYRTPCFITLQVKGNRLLAHMESPAEYFVEPKRPEVKMSVDIETVIEATSFGGFGLQHTGSVGSGATLIKDLRLEWK